MTKEEPLRLVTFRSKLLEYAKPFRVQVVQTTTARSSVRTFTGTSRSSNSPRTHPSAHASLEWQGRAFAPNRQRRVLSSAREGRHQRRPPPREQESSRVGELLQPQPATRWTRWSDSLRAVPRTDAKTVRDVPVSTPPCCAPAQYVGIVQFELKYAFQRLPSVLQDLP